MSTGKGHAPPPRTSGAHTGRSWLTSLLEAIRAPSRLANQGQPRSREIALTNHTALFSIAATLPYQLFYLTDISRYFVVFSANLLFIASYLTTLLLNRGGKLKTARAVALGTVYVQLFVVTSLISTAAGVHLFYFALGACLGMLFSTREQKAALPLVALAAVLYLVCHFAFPPGTTPIAIPEAATRVMYTMSVLGTVLITCGISYLFRLEIDRAASALMRSNRVLKQLTAVDSVTGLANRRALDAYLADQWKQLERSGGSIAVALIDIDCFKAYNDYYGHLAGDRCLQRVAEALRTVARRRDDLIARYGGEEFVIVLPATSEEAAAEVGEQVRSLIMSLGIPHDCSSVAPVVTVSVGVAGAAVEELEDFSALLHRADSALYAAKHGGRNCVARWQTLEEDATLTARRRRLAAERAHVA